MKKFLLKIIYIYQITPLSSHSKCKYYPTCSNYAKEAIFFSLLRKVFIVAPLTVILPAFTNSLASLFDTAKQIQY